MDSLDNGLSPEEEARSPLARRQSALIRLSHEIASAHDEVEVCQKVVEGLHDESLGFEFLGLFLVDPETGDRVLQNSFGWQNAKPGWRLKPGMGLNERAVLDGELHYSPRVADEPDYIATLGNGSEVDVPLKSGDDVIGVLTVESAEEGAFAAADFEILQAAANQAGIAIARARLLASERRRADEREALLATIADLSSQLDPSDLLDSVLGRAVKLLGAVGGELATYREDTGMMTVVSNYAMEEDSRGATLAYGEGAMGHVAKTGEMMIIEDYQTWEGRSDQYTRIAARAVVIAPLLIGNKPVGAMNVWHEDPDARFTEADLALLNLFGQQAAIAIDNARLFQEARNQRQYLQAVMENSPVAIVTLDLDEYVVSANPAFGQLFGYSQAEVVGQKLDPLITNEEVRAEAEAYTRQARHRPTYGMSRRCRKDGSFIDVEILAVRVEIEGQLVGMMALYHDITELLAARREAEHANQTKSQFLANMSHELRTPLNAILGYSEMLTEEAHDDGNEEYIPDLDKIHSAGKHLLALINDVLDLSKIEAGKMELYLESFDVAALMEEVSTTVRPLVEKNSNVLTVRCAEDSGEMYGDITRMRQSLLNLLSNASKFTENGTIVAEVSVEREPAGETLVFAVTDSGIGMTDEQASRLFEAFTQADASTSKRFGGTGLGLTITRKFCQMMGGDVEVQSEEGVGSTFTMRLPREVQGPAATEAEVGDGDGPLVLVIDDDEAARDIARRHLERDGYRVATASDGEIGLRLARELDPVAITLDVMMPGMDGWSVLSALKSDPDLARIPVIMLTILDEKPLGLALGASGYLTKPVERGQLLGLVGNFTHDGSRQILIVEDDEGTRQVVRRTLEGAGCTVVEAENGLVGLQRVEESRPSLILLDLMMPELDGFGFLEELRGTPGGDEIPVVVMTAKDLTDEDRERLNGGVERILEKGTSLTDEIILGLRHALPRDAGVGEGDLNA
jgi:PAS domain S-box-containing protein